jgi:hypothetical protein
MPEKATNQWLVASNQQLLKSAHIHIDCLLTPQIDASHPPEDSAERLFRLCAALQNPAIPILTTDA